MALVCVNMAGPIGLSPLYIPRLCGSQRVLVVSAEPPDANAGDGGRGLAQGLGGWLC